MRRFPLFISMMAGFSALAAAQSGLELLPADAGMVFGIEWRRIADSSIGAQLAQQIKKADLAKAPGLEGMQEMLMHDLDSVLIAAPAGVFAAGKNAGLVVVKGRFDPAKMQALFAGSKARPERYKAVELFASTQTGTRMEAAAQNAVFGLLDSGTLLAGDRTQVHAAIDRVKAGRLTPPTAGLLAGVAELAAGNDMWFIVSIPPSATKDVSQPMAQMFSDVKRADMGISFRDGMAMRMNLHAKDAAAAGTLAQTMQGLIGMAAMSQNQNPDATEMLRKLTIAPEGSRVTMALSLNQKELEVLTQQMKDRAVAGGVSGGGMAPPAPRPAPQAGIKPQPAPAAGSVRITGLDGGPVEVPMTKPNK
jgi:hypothetical protein